MTVTIKHSKTNAIADWTQAQLDEQIELGNFAPGTVLADIVLPSDWNNDHTLTGLGTMAEQDANSVAITGGTINNTTIGATTATTGRFTSVTTPSVTATTTNLNLYPASTGNVIVNQSLGGAFGLTLAQDISTPQNSARLFFDSNVNVASIRNNAGSGLAISTGATFGSSSGAIQFQVAPTTSAVNYVQVTGSATGSDPTISAQGSDSDRNLRLSPKGTGQVFSTSSFVAHSTAFNSIRLSGGASTGFATQTQAQGSDTNISMAFQPKGTGAIDLAAGSRGVNISNGGTVTAITRSATGSNYTSIPTTTISPPTTAGGVQAVAYSVIQNSAATIANGGTGYTVGNVLTMVGGTLQTGTAGTFTVSAVSGGVITAVTVLNFGQYNAIPTNPVTVTGGSGSGATLNVSYIYGYAVFTNNGSGYIEQPTVTISGGGGSGAAAYATVGGNSIVRGVGSTTSFYTPGGEAFRLVDNSQASNSYWGALGSSANSPSLRSFGASTANIDNNAAAGINFRTNLTSSSAVQMFVAHTASAVNYVQVTGSATGAAASSLGGLSFTGSDANPNFAITTKGTGYIAFCGGAATNVQAFRINTTSAANTGNLLQVQGAAAGSAPSISAISGTSGTDANIDLALTTKGTGAVRLNTGGGEQFRASNTASAVNYVQVTGGATTVSPVISAQGSDTNVALSITSKGTNAIRFLSNGAVNLQFRIVGTNAAVNNLAVTGTVAGSAPILSAEGSDTNIDLTLTPKGTGVVQFGTHTANADVAISGFITIRDAGGTLRKLAVIT